MIGLRLGDLGQLAGTRVNSGNSARCNSTNSRTSPSFLAAVTNHNSNMATKAIAALSSKAALVPHKIDRRALGAADVGIEIKWAGALFLPPFGGRPKSQAPRRHLPLRHPPGKGRMGACDLSDGSGP
jgi:hypothetical protein